MSEPTSTQIRAAVHGMLIEANGAFTSFDAPVSSARIRTLLHCEVCDTVNLRHLGDPLLVMMRDDEGHAKKLAPNKFATRLYWANCIPGTTHLVVGPVFIIPDLFFWRPGQPL